MRHIILIALIGLFALNIGAQTDVRTDFDIYLDNKKVESDNVFIGLTIPTYEPTRFVKINNSFSTWLARNRVYSITITHPGYHKQTMYVDTHNSNKDLKFKIYLKSDEPDCFNGCVKYDTKSKKYISL